MKVGIWPPFRVLKVGVARSMHFLHILSNLSRIVDTLGTEEIHISYCAHVENDML